MSVSSSFFCRSILDDSAFVNTLVPLASKLHQSSQCSPVCPTSSRETKAESHEEHSTVDRTGNAPPTQSVPHARRVPDVMSEAILLNTFQNLMMEAVRGELVLTAHPRTVILPPVSTRWGQTHCTHTHVYTLWLWKCSFPLLRCIYQDYTNCWSYCVFIETRRMSRAMADEDNTLTSQRPSSVHQQSTFPRSACSDS